MPNTRKWTLAAWSIGLAAWLVPACLTIEDEPAKAKPKGGAGESCNTRADCMSGLGCFEHVCAELDASVEASPLGGEGDACAMNADCEAALFCLNGVCSALGGDAGEPDTLTGGDAAVGDPCADTRDCAENLSCVRGVCTGSEHGLLPADKECVVLECRDAADCCPSRGYNCYYYERDCNNGDLTQCKLYERWCECDLTRWDCSNDTCSYTEPCADAGVCSPGLTCVSSTCVQCANDDDCSTGQACVGNTCKVQCQNDDDCPLFHDCVNGECVDRGCATDRECIALHDDPLAACLDGKCRESCVKDADCNGGRFQGIVCFAGHCFPMGCETDDECRAAIGTLPDGEAVECRPAK